MYLSGVSMQLDVRTQSIKSSGFIPATVEVPNSGHRSGDTSRFVWHTALATIHLINQLSEKPDHTTKMFVDDVRVLALFPWFSVMFWPCLS